MVKKTAAAVLGIIAAGGIVAVVEALGHAVYPIPPDIDFEDPVQFGIYVQSLPIGAFTFRCWRLDLRHARRRPPRLLHR